MRNVVMVASIWSAGLAAFVACQEDTSGGGPGVDAAPGTPDVARPDATFDVSPLPDAATEAAPDAPVDASADADADARADAGADAGVRSCLELRRRGVTTDGVYDVDPDGTGPLASYQAYCEMTTNGGGWTLVSNRVTTEFTGTWGTTSINPTAPSITTEYVLDYDTKLPVQGGFLMRYQGDGSSLEHAFSPSDAWEAQDGRRRRKLASTTDLLVLGATVHGGFPETQCIVNGSYGGFICDGDSNQILGQGHFNGAAGNEFPSCAGYGHHGWKPKAGSDFTGAVCDPPGYFSIFFREPLESCDELRALGGTRSGIYTIDPDGNGPTAASTTTCDPSDGGT